MLNPWPELWIYNSDKIPVYCFTLDAAVLERLCFDAWYTGIGQRAIDPDLTWQAQIRPSGCTAEGRVTALHARIRTRNGQVFTRSYTTGAFKPLTRLLAAELVQRDLLAAPEQYTCQLLVSRAVPAFALPRTYPALPATLLEKGPLVVPGQQPVVFKPSVLDAVMAEARPHRVEVGGALLGRLVRTDRGLCTLVEAQLPARHTQSSPIRLQFTGQTWMAIWDTIKQRQKNEHLVGWWHTHPFAHPSTACSASALSPNVFFSQDDLFMHGHVFANPWQVALVVDPMADSAFHPFGVFGWHQADIQMLAYHCIQE